MSRPRDAREGRERRFMLDLGQRVRALREERGLTQRQAAELAGVATDMVSRIENGHYISPGLRTLLRIADGIGVGAGELLPEPAGHRGTVEFSQRARLSALLHRASPEDLELMTELAQAILRRTRR